MYLASGVVIGVITLPSLAALLAAGLVSAVAVIGIVFLIGFALSGVVVARLERRRTQWVDTNGIEDPHRTLCEPGARAWILARLREQATWRELAFAIVSATSLWFVDAAVLAFALVLPVFCFGAPTNDPDAWPWVLIGLALLCTAPYIITAWAAARAALSRSMLSARDEEVGAALTEVTRSRARLVQAFDNERTRIERDLHDGVQQRLSSMGVSIGLLRLDATPGSPVGQQLELLHQQVSLALGELRDLTRGVQPQVLTDNGLAAAVEDIASRCATPVGVEFNLFDRVAVSIEVAMYFVISEALTNVDRYSNANNATVIGRQHDGRLVVEIRDDGRGGADPSAGTGLIGIAERLAVQGGRLKISSPAGGPTLLRAEVPCR
ncbi:sensor histidine kinase [Brevibacterium marinum]